MKILDRKIALAMLFALIAPILAACAAPAQAPVRETVVVTAPPVTVVVTAVPEAAPTPTGAFRTPHPILSDVRVRQAIAYCTNRLELIQSVYSFLTPEQQQQLLMDTFLPKTHWAVATEADGIVTYPFDPEKGKALLEEAGWKLAEGQRVRTKDGVPLALEFTTTNAQFRITWATVLEKQLLDNCGIQIIRKHAPASWWFGGASGLRRRDFELGAFAWVGEADPGGRSLYACDQIPLPDNNWEGQNYMGWCNETASRAIVAANNTLNREERIKHYKAFQVEFTKDMVSLPLFQRLEAYAWNKALTGLKPDPTEYITANAHEWGRTDNGDTIILGFTQEPASMFSLVESAAVQVQAAQLVFGVLSTQYSYDFQPVLQDGLSTIESGKAKNEVVEVKEGDKVWNTEGAAVELKPGVEIVNSDGETIKYESGTVKMKQLTVTYDLIKGIKWSDGEPLKKADLELAVKINCDRESGATSFTFCESHDNLNGVTFNSDTSYTIKFLPGVQWPTYFLAPYGGYPSHRTISDGRKLADVPAKEWSTLPEIAELPMGYGPYILKEWKKKEFMRFEANPNFVLGAPKVKNVVIQFFADTNAAVAALLTGEVDILEKATLGAGPEVETVIKAAQEGKINVKTDASPTWEHMDFNLFVR
ncbi:MAG: ABC transporter substrate-binding protein [Roseiflexus sp.]|nr:ABC transporter substrate-binding protein [Roseiflexus sp.]MCS7290783.1 ABC transporter substrate-binding protein [Roseiflexus sp.]MDW8231411.1 ABC transporter substrate-binding protein [Roseiflexaceae bacterium]